MKKFKITPTYYTTYIRKAWFALCVEQSGTFFNLKT